MTSMLSIHDLHVTVGGKEILNGLSLEVGTGEVHAIMGPNGSGKSTLAYLLAGRPGYEVTAGTVRYEGRDLLTLAPEERARAGLFLGFQYPVEIPGVNNVYLLKAAVNAARQLRGLPEVDAFEFLGLVREKMKLMHMEDSFLSRGVNEGFSGGEKKRNEILQMLVLEPRLAILDETDSGLDIDALKVVAAGVNSQRSPQSSCVFWCAGALPRAATAPSLWSSSGAVTTGSRARRREAMSTPLSARIAEEYASAVRAHASAADGPRHAAIEALAAKGLPSSRDENWKYANLRSLEAQRFVPATQAPPANEAGASAPANLAPVIPGFSRYVFIDGVFAPQQSAALAATPARISSGAPGMPMRALGSDERFALLNQAFATDSAAGTWMAALSVAKA
jgi:Fe-S cluster assembly ATP-binding protein